MKKRVFGRKFSRTTNQRKQLFQNLLRSFVIYGRLKTTEAKAKAIKGEIEKMLTLTKNKGDEAKSQLIKVLKEEAADHLIKNIAPSFKDRSGGYTRIVRFGNRLKDNAPLVLMEWVDWSMNFVLPIKSKKRAEKSTKKIESRMKAKENKKEDKVIEKK